MKVSDIIGHKWLVVQKYRMTNKYSRKIITVELQKL